MSKAFIKSIREPAILASLVLGFSSGLPFALSGSTLQAFCTDQGFSLQEIGLVGIASIPYAKKFLWAPLLDRWALPFLGRRRGWIVVFQLLLCLSIASMGLIKPDTSLSFIFYLVCFLAFCSASQDIVINAYQVDVLRSEQKAMGAAMGINGYRIATLISGGLALAMADVWGWQNMFFTMAALMLVGTIMTAISPKEQTVQSPKNIKDSVVLPFLDFFKRENAIGIVLFIIFYKLGDAFAGALTYAFLLREIQFSLSEVGTFVKVSGFIGTIAGTILGAWYLQKLGWFRALLGFGVLQAVSNLTYLVLLSTGPNYMVVSLAIFLENLFGGMGTAVFTGLLMALCNRRFTAFQFALLSSLSSIGRVYIGWTAGYVAEHYGWINYFMSSLLFAIPGLVLVCLLKGSIEQMTNQQQENNEKMELEVA